MMFSTEIGDPINAYILVYIKLVTTITDHKHATRVFLRVILWRLYYRNIMLLIYHICSYEIQNNKSKETTEMTSHDSKNIFYV